MQEIAFLFWKFFSGKQVHHSTFLRHVRNQQPQDIAFQIPVSFPKRRVRTYRGANITICISLKSYYHFLDCFLPFWEIFSKFMQKIKEKPWYAEDGCFSRAPRKEHRDRRGVCGKAKAHHIPRTDLTFSGYLRLGRLSLDRHFPYVRLWIPPVSDTE